MNIFPKDLKGITPFPKASLKPHDSKGFGTPNVNYYCTSPTFGCAKESHYPLGTCRHCFQQAEYGRGQNQQQLTCTGGQDTACLGCGAETEVVCNDLRDSMIHFLNLPSD